MCKISMLSAMLAMAALSACATGDAPSRSLIGDEMSLNGAANAGAVSAGMMVERTHYNVARITVTVPRSLRVSEENVFFPAADIVWHGDPSGDRNAQVASVLQDGAAMGALGMKAGRAVEVQIEVTRFHALTPKVRYTVGGMFTTHFLLTVQDAQTGAVIDGPRPVVADVYAAGGPQAVAEEAAGLTQRVVIENRVAAVIRRELSERLVPVGGAGLASRGAFTPEDLATLQ